MSLYIWLDLLSFTGIYAVTKGDKYACSLAMELQLLGISVETGMLGVFTRELDRFCEKTKLYPCNARRFHRIVDRVEASRSCRKRSGKKRWRSSEKNPRLLLTASTGTHFCGFWISARSGCSCSPSARC